MKIPLIFALLFSMLYASFPEDVSSQILYCMYRGDSEKALSTYLDYAKKSEIEDYELLQEACIRLLERGMRTAEIENQLMCMFGAGISTNHALIPILQKGLESKELKIQLTALHYLSNLNDDAADNLITDCLSSPHLLLRLEAALILARKSDASIVEQMESLYYKVDKRIRPVFAEIIAGVQTPNATKFLEKLMGAEEREVRLYTIIEAGKKKRDDLLPKLQKIATLPDGVSQEAALSALCDLQDSASKSLFWQMSKKQNPYLQLIAWKALHKTGEPQVLAEIEKCALSHNLFAINLYGELASSDASKELLVQLLKESDYNIRLNASLALLKQADTRALPFLQELLLQKAHPKYVTQQFSPGKSLIYWMETHGSEKSEMETLRLRQKILRMALELPEEDFLKLARALFNHNQTDLIPSLIELMVNHDTPLSVALLKEMQQKTGAPFIRNYCNLALYRLQIPGPYEENLLRFVKDEKNHPLISFEDVKKEDELNVGRSMYSLKPEERSQLLITSFETLASRQNGAGIRALIHAVAYGHAQNRYALAGLLIRTIE